MSTNDTAKLYQFFGGQASDYQELRRSDDAKSGKERWPLLAWLDLGALHVPDAPKVHVGEVVTQPVAKNAPQAKPMPSLSPVAPVAPVASFAPTTHIVQPAPVAPAAHVAPVAQVVPAAPAAVRAATSTTALQQMFVRLAQAPTSAAPTFAAAATPAGVHAQTHLQASTPEQTPPAPARSPLWTQLSKL